MFHSSLCTADESHSDRNTNKWGWCGLLTASWCAGSLSILMGFHMRVTETAWQNEHSGHCIDSLLRQKLCLLKITPLAVGKITIQDYSSYGTDCAIIPSWCTHQCTSQGFPLYQWYSISILALCWYYCDFALRCLKVAYLQFMVSSSIDALNAFASFIF